MDFYEVQNYWVLILAVLNLMKTLILQFLYPQHWYSLTTMFGVVRVITINGGVVLYHTSGSSTVLLKLVSQIEIRS